MSFTSGLPIGIVGDTVDAKFIKHYTKGSESK